MSIRVIRGFHLRVGYRRTARTRWMRILAGLGGVAGVFSPTLIFDVNRIVRALGLPVVCLATFAVVGGHWAVLQTVAWGTMLWDYSAQEGSVVAGALKTFSGEAPCTLCESIVEARKQEEKAPVTVKVGKKVEVALVDFGNFVSLPISRDRDFPGFEGQFFTRSERPPTPVPILGT